LYLKKNVGLPVVGRPPSARWPSVPDDANFVSSESQPPPVMLDAGPMSCPSATSETR
jgi:hypothetical protein